ncbi:MAG: hypothetical protein ACUVX9_17300 [Anaerolineae bacterium]
MAAIRARHGPAAIKTVTCRHIPALPSAIPALDELLQGGFPTGKCHEILAYGTAGQGAIAAGLLAQAQCRSAVAYVDVHGHVDLEGLVRCGVDLGALAVLRPADLCQAVSMVTDLLRSGLSVAIVFDRLRLPPPPCDRPAIGVLQGAAREWVALLDASASLVLILTELASPSVQPIPSPVSHAAHVRLLCERQAWLQQGRRTVGFESRVTLLKAKNGISGRHITLRFCQEVTHGPHNSTTAHRLSPFPGLAGRGGGRRGL